MTLDITGGAVLIDEADVELVSRLRWHVNSNGYAVWRGILNGKKQTVRMHRLIAETPTDKVTDHLNHNKLDNRRKNLRVCTQVENLRNQTSPGKGYWYSRQISRWVVDVWGKHRGTFEDEGEAADWVARVRRGEVDIKPKFERTHCINGHPLTQDGVYIVTGRRVCKLCQKNRSAAYYVRRQQLITKGI